MSTARMMAMAGSLILVPVVIGQEAAKRPLAHFRFNGSFEDASGNENTVTANNARFKDDALYANGKYDVGGRPDALTCKINTPALSYNAFTLGIRIKPYRFREYSYRNIITGGPDYRWFSLRVSESGKLLVKLNNHRFERPLPYEVVPNRWTTIVCGVDVNDKVVRVYVNGKGLPTINLPKGFEFKVASSKQRDADKIWTFANYANGSTFHGLVDELVIFDGMLTSEEMARLKLPLPTGR